MRKKEVTLSETKPRHVSGFVAMSCLSSMLTWFIIFYQTLLVPRAFGRSDPQKNLTCLAFRYQSNLILFSKKKVILFYFVYHLFLSLSPRE